MNKKAVSVTLTLCTLLTSTLLTSCSSNSESSFADIQLTDPNNACTEYLDAYEKSDNLDPAGEAVVGALDIPELTKQADDLTEQLRNLEENHPEISLEAFISGDLSPTSETLSEELRADLRDYGKAFFELDTAVRKACAELLDAEIDGGSSNAPVTTITQTIIMLDRPIMMDVCNDMSVDMCTQQWYQQDMLSLGYRLPPADGIPSSANRDEAYWANQSPSKRDQYLTVALWNFIARIGIDQGEQYWPIDTIRQNFETTKADAVWLVENVRKGFAPADLLQSLQEELKSQDIPDWMSDWIINAIVYVALPAIAPELIEEVDSVIVYRN